MAEKTRSEIYTQIDNTLPDNNSNDIVPVNHRTLVKDLSDSVVFKGEISGSSNTVNVQYTGISPISTNLSITFTNTPLGDIIVTVNGVDNKVGNTVNDSFFVKNTAGDIKTIGNVNIGDVLHYNSTSLGYLIDSLDVIVITYQI